MTVRRIALAGALVALLLGGGEGGAQTTGERSPGVSLVRSVAEPGIVSAKAVGSLLYVSALTGVSIYDIADPLNPTRIGRLDLPNSQNEDVDVGNGVMLVSDDPLGGRGILYVIDIRDPRQPRLLSRYSTWRPGRQDDPYRRRALARRGNNGHTATCIQDCRWVWLTGSAPGIEVVDLRDPRRPRYAGVVTPRAAGPLIHDVQIDGQGLAWTAGRDGTAALDVSRPTRPRLVARTDRRGGRSPWNNFIHHNSLRIDAATLLVTEEDFGRSQCRGAGSFQTWRIGGGRIIRPLDRFAPERDGRLRLACSAHYFDHRDGLVAAGFYEQGLRLLDVRDPARITQVGFYIADTAMVWGAMFALTDPSGSVVYVLDHARGIDIVSLDRSALAPITRPDRRTDDRGARFDVGVAIEDGVDTARPGQRLTITAAIGSVGRDRGNAAVEVQLPSRLTLLRAPRGARYDPGARTLTLPFGRFRRVARRTFSVRVSRSARRGTSLELIAYVRGVSDLMPITDRWVDHVTIGRRTRFTPRRARIARTQRRAGVCVIGATP